MTRLDRLVLLRKLQRARMLYESAIEMQAVANGLFLESRRLVDEIEDLRAGRPAVPRLTLVRPRQLVGNP